MSKLILTGAAGFIGSHIGEALLKDGFDVVGIDNLNNYYSLSLKRRNLSFLEKNTHFSFVKGDIVNSNFITHLLKKEKPDYLIHCAARAGVRASLDNPLLYVRVNTLGTTNILEGLRLYSPKTKTILLSSSSIYGIQSITPFEESMVPNPLSPYGASKYAMETIANQYFQFYQLPLVIVRPFSIYGPRGRIDMAPFLVIRAAEAGQVFIQYGSNENNRRDWTYIDDFVAGIMKLLKNYSFKEFQIFNLGNSQPIGIDNFINLSRQLIKEYLDEDLKISHQPRGKVELPITYANIKKARTAFGYHPKTSLAEGLEKLYQYYRANRGLYLKVFGLN